MGPYTNVWYVKRHLSNLALGTGSDTYVSDMYLEVRSIGTGLPSYGLALAGSQ